MEDLGTRAERTDEPEKKVNKRRITASQNKTKKYKATRIKNKWRLPGVQNQPAELQSISKGKHIYKLLLMNLKRLRWKRMMHYTVMLSMTNQM